MNRPLLLVLVALVPAALVPAALAQAPEALRVADPDGATRLRLDTRGGLLVTGTVSGMPDPATIPATGAGTRLVFWPERAAFRVGTAVGTEWDGANVGSWSFAGGYQTRASGFAALALGSSTTASNSVSTALGYKTTASGIYSTAMGYETTASSGYSTAMGYQTAASGVASTAMGYHTTARAYASLVIGRYNTVSGTIIEWVSTEPLFVAGNGAGDASRSNALTLFKNGNLTIAGTLTQSSDVRLKEAVEPLTDALAALAELQPVRYRFRAGTNRPGGPQIGLLAHEVEAVLPELVREEPDGYLSVSYANMAAVLVQAVNEQQGQIEQQDAEIAALEARLAAVEAGCSGPLAAGGWGLGLAALLGLAGLVVRAERRRP